MNGLVTKNIFKSIKRNNIVNGVEMQVQRGEITGLLGPNGAGKTTLFYIIIGLVAADRGSIFLDDMNITNFPMYRRGRMGINYLPQETSIFKDLTVSQNILGIIELIEKDKKKRKGKLERLLYEFGLEKITDRKGYLLSGGEKRRVEIARALASEPSFILLDEPFAGVDPISIDEVKHLIISLANRGIGVLITDHNVRETLEIVDKAYIMMDGSILFKGLSHDVKNNEQVKNLYLGRTFE